MQRWSQNKGRKEAEEVINEKKYSALEKNKETEETRSNKKEGEWDKDILRESIKKWAEDSFGIYKSSSNKESGANLRRWNLKKLLMGRRNYRKKIAPKK